MTTLVLGLDGASFELLGPWMEEGALPNLQRLAERGVAEDMQSCLPPVTCPNWQCYATGTNPGKLGVFWWEAVDREAGEVRNTSGAGQFGGRHYWTLLNGDAAVVNLPTSYPPPEIDGVHVAGGPGADQTGYASPTSVEADLKECFDYRVHPEKTGLLDGGDPDNECVEEIYDLLEMRFDAATALLDDGEYELLHLTAFYVNVLQHFYWDHPVVKEAWRRIDRGIGKLVGRPEVDTVFAMSDHGANEIRNSFRVNAWLVREGYLVITRGFTDLFHSLGVTKERVRPVLARLGLEWWLRRLVPDRIQLLLPDEAGAVDGSAKEPLVDWETSTAIASGQGPVYVIADAPSERQRIADEIAAKLDDHTTPEGTPLVKEVLRGEELYDGPHVDQGPDLVLRQASGVHIEGRIGTHSPYGEPAKWRGENKETGLFIAAGDGIDPAASLSDMHILDIAPSVLHLHGQAVPSVMDGEVRTDLFAPGTPASSRSVRQTDRRGTATTTGGEVDGAVSGRLDDLGYLE